MINNFSCKRNCMARLLEMSDRIQNSGLVLLKCDLGEKMGSNLTSAMNLLVAVAGCYLPGKYSKIW